MTPSKLLTELHRAHMKEAAPIGGPYGVPPSLILRLTLSDIEVLMDALARAASRLESMARTAKHGRKHDQAAIRMRSLRARIWRQKNGNP
jgi:hypothetical protein